MDQENVRIMSRRYHHFLHVGMSSLDAMKATLKEVKTPLNRRIKTAVAILNYHSETVISISRKGVSRGTAGVPHAG